MLSLRSRHHKVVQSSHQILINSSHNLLFFRLPRTIISYSSACIIFRFREGMRPRVHLHRTDLVDPMLVAPTLGTYPIQTFHHINRGLPYQNASTTVSIASRKALHLFTRVSRALKCFPVQNPQTDYFLHALFPKKSFGQYLFHMGAFVFRFPSDTKRSSTPR